MENKIDEKENNFENITEERLEENNEELLEENKDIKLEVDYIDFGSDQVQNNQLLKAEAEEKTETEGKTSNLSLIN